MRAINIIISQEEERQLQSLALFSFNVTLRNRCRIVLLRANGVATKAIADFVGLKPQSVNRWLKAYAQNGVGGLVGNLKNALESIDQTGTSVLKKSGKTEKSKKESRCLRLSSSVNCLSTPDAAIRLICDNINSWNSQTNIFAKMNPLDILALVRNDCMQTAFLLGASPLMNELSYNIQRHEVLDGNGKIPMPGAKIASTVEPGVDFNGEALVRAKVILK